jgi:hypothetical protein
MPLTTNPAIPFMKNGPGAIPERPRIRYGKMAARYESEPSVTKDPMNALKAVVEPTYIAPKIVHKTEQINVALKGDFRVGLIRPTKVLNGAALSRPRVHSMRPAVI